MARTAGSTGEKTARLIAEAAVKLFAERGYAAVSMRAIADAVGIQVGALYNHFATKQDVLLTVLTEHMSNVLGEWEKLDCETVPPVEGLETFTRFHVRYHMDLHDQVFISFMELRSLEPDNFKQVETIRQRYEYRLRDLLARGKADGTFQIDDPHVTAMALLAMLTGVTNWYKPGGRLSGDDIEEMYVRLAHGVVGLADMKPSNMRKVG